MVVGGARWVVQEPGPLLPASLCVIKPRGGMTNDMDRIPDSCSMLSPMIMLPHRKPAAAQTGSGEINCAD